MNTSRRVVGLVAVGLLAGPVAAHAATVTFNFNAFVTTNVGAWDPALDLGNPLSISVSFDSAAALLHTRYELDGITVRRLEFDPSSISMTLNAGSLTETRSSAGPGDLMWMRDNMSNPDCGSGNAFTDLCGPVDGLSFQISSPDGLSFWSLILRGTINDLITGSALPTFQDDRWANQEIAQFAMYRDCSTAEAEGTCALEATIAPVPLPAAAWLLFSGLGGLGVLGRRRKAA